MLFSSPHLLLPLLPLLPLREIRLFASLLPIRAIRGRSSSLRALTAPGRRAYAVGRTRATRAKTRGRVWCREVDKEKPIWLTRGKGTKARENSRRRPSSVQRRSGKQRKKRRASRCELGSARDCHVLGRAGGSCHWPFWAGDEQTPHPRASDAPSRGIKFPISSQQKETES